MDHGAQRCLLRGSATVTRPRRRIGPRRSSAPSHTPPGAVTGLHVCPPAPRPAQLRSRAHTSGCSHGPPRLLVRPAPCAHGRSRQQARLRVFSATPAAPPLPSRQEQSRGSS
ncbi:hypothetical protein NDU88_002486 [Pleurodeles waltl]|uniref:Uncharacterized protein n=1 Tax=Pleurodeles waltl TaxID=8319 RepID=A0AAV7RE15_PLEWA|nr:hypothetical protein NDU88_002486 [Pleurodeles waltl]